MLSLRGDPPKKTEMNHDVTSLIEPYNSLSVASSTEVHPSGSQRFKKAGGIFAELFVTVM